MNTFQSWMAKATSKEKERLARLARTTVGTLRQLAGGYRTKGRVSASPELARRIEIAALKIGESMPRETMCAACRQCEYVKRRG